MTPEVYAERAVRLLEEKLLLTPEIRERIQADLADLFREAGKEAIKDNKVPAATEAVWIAYSEEYHRVYGHYPLDGAKIRGMMKAFLRQVPVAEAPELVRFYVNHPDKFYALNRHPFSFCLTHLQRLHSEWKSRRIGSSKTAHGLSQIERIRRGEL